MRFTHIPCHQYDLTAVTANGQRWYTTPDGSKYPSITTVLGQKEKPAITAWRMSLGPQKADKETKRCTDRGDAVHLMAEHYLNNEENPTKGHQRDHIKLFSQLKFVLNKINNIRAQEIPLFSDRIRVAGRVDCIGEYDGVLSIIDFKTSNGNKDAQMIEDYFLQATAYALMYEEMYGEFIDQIVIIIAVEKGMVPLVFKRQIDDYVVPLLERINTFHTPNKGVQNGKA